MAIKDRKGQKIIIRNICCHLVTMHLFLHIPGYKVKEGSRICYDFPCLMEGNTPAHQGRFCHPTRVWVPITQWDKQAEMSRFRAEKGLQWPNKEKGWLILKRPELPDGFQGRVFKGNIWGEGRRVCDFLLIGWWWGNRVMFPESQSPTFCFQLVWRLSTKLPSSAWVEASVPAEQLKDLHQIIMYILEEEQGLCFIIWTTVSWPLFLCFCLSSLP